MVRAVDIYGELSPTERIARTTYLLSIGRKLTSAEVAADVGITPEGAWRMLSKLAQVLPIENHEGSWYIERRGR